MNHNTVLGVGNNASKEEINSAYRKAAKELHPDVNDSPEAQQAFENIKRARDTLLENTEEKADASSIKRSTDAAVRATTTAAYAKKSTSSSDDTDVAAQQELDRLAHQPPSKHDSPEVKRHRKRLKTMQDRIVGKY